MYRPHHLTLPHVVIPNRFSPPLLFVSTKRYTLPLIGLPLVPAGKQQNRQMAVLVLTDQNHDVVLVPQFPAVKANRLAASSGSGESSCRLLRQFRKELPEMLVIRQRAAEELVASLLAVTGGGCFGYFCTSKSSMGETGLGLIDGVASGDEEAQIKLW